MVKVQIEANELRNGNIEKISLVTHGAIRQPFKILKTQEIGDAPQTMGDKLHKFFGGSSHDKAQIAAVYVRKDVAAEWIPLIKSNGFRAEKAHASIEGDVLVLKQKSYDEEVSGSVVALTPDVAVQFDRVVKYFDPYPESASFDENVRAAGFYPGMSNALSTLAETVWNVLNESEDTEEAAATIGKQIKAFGVHVNALVSELPQAVFKMEHESLTKKFEGSTVSPSSTTIIVDDEDSNMSTAVLKEAAAGDLEGLLDDAPAADAALEKADADIEKGVAEEAAGTEVVYLDKEGTEISEAAFDALDTEVKKDYVLKGGDEGAPKSGGSPGNPVVDNTSDTGAVSLDEGGVPEGFRKEERLVKELVDGKLVEKHAVYFINDETKEEIFGGFFEKASADPVAATEAVDGQAYSPAEVKLFEAMGILAKSVTDLKDMVEKQADKIETVAKTAEVAKETAEDTVVLNVADDLDESLASLQGHQSAHQVLKSGGTVEKSDNDIFKGLLPQLESNAA